MNQSAAIRFEPIGVTVMVPVGSTLLRASREAGLDLDAPCGGTGKCGACLVIARGALTPPTTDETALLGAAGLEAGRRLACRARATGDVVVTVEPQRADVRVVSASLEEPLAVEPPEERGLNLEGTLVGAAIDIGTTTIAVDLLDLKTGETLVSAGDLNRQRAYGADVISRVAFASSGGESELQTVVVGQIEAMLSDVIDEAGLANDTLVEAVVVGNTTMTGLLLGADVSTLGAAPYAGAPLAATEVSADAIGMRAFPALDLLVLPGISAFVGSDVTAGILATGIDEPPACTLMLDLGTNGEMVLATGEHMVAASAAAGPALEGASISSGMRATAGAIERVSLVAGDLELGVIGTREPAGICGSGLLDLVAVLLDAGVLDSSGRFSDDAPGRLAGRLTERDGIRAFRVDARGDVLLTQKDVREVQLAIGAVRAGIEILLAEAPAAHSDIASVIVAGGFGYHVRPASLARLGVVPALWEDRVTFAGNAALAGARCALVSARARARTLEIVGGVRIVDLAAHPSFHHEFMAALEFPTRAGDAR